MTPEDRWPYIVLVIDEMANLILTDKRAVEKRLADITAMSRAVGIHVILATQRPSADIVTGIIRANVPMRVAFAVVTRTESRIILDEDGADTITERGQFLVRIPGQRGLERLQGKYISEADIAAAVIRTRSHP
jgi:DNA segregation ATPase FtsK/SpoIIIE, S-DNA-T family